MASDARLMMSVLIKNAENLTDSNTIDQVQARPKTRAGNKENSSLVLHDFTLIGKLKSSGELRKKKANQSKQPGLQKHAS
ncbi:hypothetical protein RND71_030443 [Anisodus tanguticus]|uniref:Uncharacterized protein n=1 Tax=Anisodus tanguticus TaxID=243964 RepID=A0AAE1V878_9SOLA|nr:hypothetical protein RND71_030443 [Anisodus tanguticus]